MPEIADVIPDEVAAGAAATAEASSATAAQTQETPQVSESEEHASPEIEPSQGAGDSDDTPESIEGVDPNETPEQKQERKSRTGKRIQTLLSDKRNTEAENQALKARLAAVLGGQPSAQQPVPQAQPPAAQPQTAVSQPTQPRLVESLELQRDDLFQKYEQAKANGDAANAQFLARQYNQVQSQIAQVSKAETVQEAVRAVESRLIQKVQAERLAGELIQIDSRFPILKRDGSGRVTPDIDPNSHLVRLATRHAMQDGVTLQKEHLFRAERDLLLAAAQSVNASNARVRTTAQSYLDRTGLEAGGASAPPPPTKSPLEGVDREGLANAVARQVRGKK